MTTVCRGRGTTRPAPPGDPLGAGLDVAVLVGECCTPTPAGADPDVQAVSASAAPRAARTAERPGVPAMSAGIGTILAGDGDRHVRQATGCDGGATPRDLAWRAVAECGTWVQLSPQSTERYRASFAMAWLASSAFPTRPARRAAGGSRRRRRQNHGPGSWMRWHMARRHPSRTIRPRSTLSCRNLISRATTG